MTIMLIFYVKEELDSFVSEMDDWKGEGAKVFLSGITNKASYGFLLVEWGKPIPARFRQKMRDDPDVMDYLVFGKSQMTEDAAEHNGKG
jgi:hypothetical protein